MDIQNKTTHRPTVKDYLSLFLSFAKVGVMTFGGGYAMLPILEREIVDNKKWASNEEMLDYYAISQCTPGVIAVNVATFIGKKCFGVLGGILATIGVVFPSLVIITLLAAFIQHFSDIPWVQHAFAGIRVCVCVLIFNMIFKLAKSSIKNIWCLFLFIGVLLASLLTDLSPVVFVLASAFLAIIFSKIGGAGK